MNNGGIRLLVSAQLQALVWMVYSLPLVPLESMTEALLCLDDEVSSMVQDDLNLWASSFIRYVKDTWFTRYSPQDWSHATSESYEHITNNAAGIIYYFYIQQ